jgi:hypothetical protein
VRGRFQASASAKIFILSAGAQNISSKRECTEIKTELGCAEDFKQVRARRDFEKSGIDEKSAAMYFI